MNNRNFRLALISTPRSGNTWLRLLLGDLYALEHFAVHSPDDLVWDALPKRCILQLHWSRTDDFIARLQQYGFRTITIARHPLDVLLSILHFSAHEPQTALWLAGRGGNEKKIIGQCPTSRPFLDYALSDRFEYLLSVSADWWNYSDVSVMYEDLVALPERVLQHITHQLGPPVSSIADVIAKYTFLNLKPTSNNEHFWKGSPGLWKHVMPSESSLAIYSRHQEIFRVLGYDVEDMRQVVAKCAQKWKEINGLL